jgi:hypothetical protein
MNQSFVITTTMWQYYLATWQAVFREFFGWSDAKTLHWTEHRYHFPLDTDWRPYREKIARILAEYGAALPATPAR